MMCGFSYDVQDVYLVFTKIRLHYRFPTDTHYILNRIRQVLHLTRTLLIHLHGREAHSFQLSDRSFIEYGKRTV